MDILVLGGTGFIGSHLSRELVDRGHEVTTISRTQPTETLPESISWVRGDVTRYNSIAHAFEGQDAIVNLVAVSPLYQPKGGNKMHDRVHRAGTKNAVEAAENYTVPRFVQMSGIHADPNAPTAYLRAKGKAEEIVRESSLEWVIHRPTTAFGDGGEFIPFIKKVAPPVLTPLPGGGRTRFQLIWVGDLVPILADSIVSDQYVGGEYELGGNEVLSLKEIAKTVHGAAGRPVTVIPIPMAMVGLVFRVGEYVPLFPFGADQYRSLSIDLVAQDNEVGAFDVDPESFTSLEKYLSE